MLNNTEFKQINIEVQIYPDTYIKTFMLIRVYDYSIKLFCSFVVIGTQERMQENISGGVLKKLEFF